MSAEHNNHLSQEYHGQEQPPLPEPLFTRSGIPLLPEQVVASYLHVARSRISILARKGKIHSSQPGRERWVNLDEVQDWQRSRNPKGGRPRRRGV